MNFYRISSSIDNSMMFIFINTMIQYLFIIIANTHNTNCGDYKQTYHFDFLNEQNLYLRHNKKSISDLIFLYILQWVKQYH